MTKTAWFRAIALIAAGLLLATACSSDDLETDLDANGATGGQAKTLTIRIGNTSLADMQAKGQVIGIAREFVDGNGQVHELTQWATVPPQVAQTQLAWTDELIAYAALGPVEIGAVISPDTTTSVSLGQALELANGSFSSSGNASSSDSVELSISSSGGSSDTTVGLAAEISVNSGATVMAAIGLFGGQVSVFTPTDIIYLYVTRDGATNVVLDQISVYKLDLSSKDSAIVTYDSGSGFSES